MSSCCEERVHVRDNNTTFATCTFGFLLVLRARDEEAADDDVDIEKRLLGMLGVL